MQTKNAYQDIFYLLSLSSPLPSLSENICVKVAWHNARKVYPSLSATHKPQTAFIACYEIILRLALKFTYNLVQSWFHSLFPGFYFVIFFYFSCNKECKLFCKFLCFFFWRVASEISSHRYRVCVLSLLISRDNLNTATTSVVIDMNICNW